MLAPFLALAMMQAFSPNGTDLQKQCRLYVTAMDETRPLDIDESYQAGVCFGFIGGIAQGLNTLKVSCPPSTATLNTMVRIYLVYVEKHPKVLDFDRSSGAYGAFKEAYPCSK